jgi:hypothetical protein
VFILPKEEKLGQQMDKETICFPLLRQNKNQNDLLLLSCSFNWPNNVTTDIE